MFYNELPMVFFAEMKNNVCGDFAVFKGNSFAVFNKNSIRISDISAVRQARNKSYRIYFRNL